MMTASSRLRQALLAISAGPFDVRLGRQQVVWGEATGTFITDVVNPKDFREFVLPEFTQLRLSLWAVNGTYHLAAGLNLEGVWTPDIRFNRVGKPGSEFQFQPPRFRIVGVTLSKSLEPVVVRSEAAFTIGKRYETTDPLDTDGVVRCDTLDYLVGVDYTFLEQFDVALQAGQKILTGLATNFTRGAVEAQVTSSVSVRLTTGFCDNTLNLTLFWVINANRGNTASVPRSSICSGARSQSPSVWTLCWPSRHALWAV
jgi:hypothetical protein